MNRNFQNVLGFFFMVIIFGAALALISCPKPGGKECPPCAEGEICDEETGKCVPDSANGNGNGNGNGGGNGPPEELLCGSDFDDCEEGEICDLTTGECVPGFACDPNLGPSYATNANCNWNMETNSNDPGWGCGGVRADDCVCDPSDGICRRRRQSCEPCNNDEECGPHSHFTDPAECVPFEGGNVCLVVYSPRGCPAGYQNNDDGYCEPSGGSCEEIFACTSDADCPEDRPICHRATGTCRAGCVFDFAEGESVGCPPNQVCHGDGRCRADCETDTACREINPDFICFDEPTGSRRCRIEGCLHDIECPVPSDGPYLGFCDLHINDCFSDRCSRFDFDSELHEEPDRHCRDGFACRDNGVCEQMACIERAAPSIACPGIGQMCCGFCRNLMNNPERDECDPTPCPPSFETPEGAVEGCFWVEKSKWCVDCEDHDECDFLDNPPADPRDKNFCLQNRCALTCETSLDCPVRWQCNPLIIGCDIDDHCGPEGRCVLFDEEDPDAGKICECENAAGEGDDILCGPDTRCLRSFGRYMCGVGMLCMEQASEEEGSYCDTNH